jgi:hypothetical protein
MLLEDNKGFIKGESDSISESMSKAGYKLVDLEAVPPYFEKGRPRYINDGGIRETVDSDFEKQPYQNTDADKMASIRALRDSKLEASDKYMLADYPVDAEIKTLWVNYRQQLRDLPKNIVIGNIDTVDDVTWPMEP